MLKYHCTTKKKFTARKNGRWIVIAGGRYNNPTSADFQDQFVRVGFPNLKFVILATFVSSFPFVMISMKISETYRSD